MLYSQVLLIATHHVILGTFEAFLGNGDAAAEHWSSALAVTLTQNQTRIAEGLCRLLLPFG